MSEAKPYRVREIRFVDGRVAETTEWESHYAYWTDLLRKTHAEHPTAKNLCLLLSSAYPQEEMQKAARAVAAEFGIPAVFRSIG